MSYASAHRVEARKEAIRRLVAAVRGTGAWLGRPPVIYNLSVLAGIGLVSAGADRVYGSGIAFMATGALVLVFTLYAAERLTRRPR